MTSPRQLVAPALGIDISTHAVHMALVGRDVIVASAIVSLDKRTVRHQVGALTATLRDLLRGRPTFAVLERPYVGHENVASALKLARLAGIIEAVATIEGYEVRPMLASEWRPLAGITLSVGGGVHRVLRAELKREAMRLVQMEYGLATKDDNLAEAVLMGRVGVGLARREALA